MKNTLRHWQYASAFMLVLLVVVLGGYLAYLIGAEKFENRTSSAPEVKNVAPNQFILSESTAKQVRGDSFPLLPGPTNNIYTLRGSFTDFTNVNTEIEPNFIIRVLGKFEYTDANGGSQSIYIPLIIDNTKNKESVYFDRGYSLEPTTDERIGTYINEKLSNLSVRAEKAVITFQSSILAKEAPYSAELLGDLIDKYHPNGFDEFVVSGNPQDLGNDSSWIIPLDLAIDK